MNIFNPPATPQTSRFNIFSGEITPINTPDAGNEASQEPSPAQMAAAIEQQRIAEAAQANQPGIDITTQVRDLLRNCSYSKAFVLCLERALIAEQSKRPACHV